MRTLRIGAAACAATVLMVTVSCSTQDREPAASAAALETLSNALGPFTATIVTEAEDYTITEVVVYTDTRNWSRTVVDTEGPNINLPAVGSRQVMNGSIMQDIAADVVDLQAFFTEEELADFGKRLNGEGPSVIDRLVREGVIVPGDFVSGDYEVPEGERPQPHLLFAFHGSDNMAGLEPELLEGGAFRLRVMSTDVIEFDRYGTPTRMVFHDRDGSVLTTATVTHFKAF